MGVFGSEGKDLRVEACRSSGNDGDSNSAGGWAAVPLNTGQQFRRKGRGGLELLHLGL